MIRNHFGKLYFEILSKSPLVACSIFEEDWFKNWEFATKNKKEELNYKYD